MIVLGSRPEDLAVILVRRYGFVVELQADPGPWPDGSGIELRFRASDSDETPIVWAASISGGAARIERSAADVAAVLDEGHERVALVYRDPGGTELPWGIGVVNRG